MPSFLYRSVLTGNSEQEWKKALQMLEHFLPYPVGRCLFSPNSLKSFRTLDNPPHRQSVSLPHHESSASGPQKVPAEEYRCLLFSFFGSLVKQ